MIKFEKTLPKAARLMPPGWQVEASPNGALLTFPTGRNQRVRVERQAERYVLSSTILGSAQSSEYSDAELLPWLWRLNREVGVVGFMIDRKNRLVGRIEQLADTLDAAELALYLQLLARECDRLEYVLTGHDYA